MASGNTKRNRLRRLFKEQEGLCFYCDELCWLPWTSPRDPRRMATREHLKRKAEGGKDGIQNLAMACLECNGKRDDRAPEVWIAERGGELPGDADGCTRLGSYLRQTYDFAPLVRTRA